MAGWISATVGAAATTRPKFAPALEAVVPTFDYPCPDCRATNSLHDTDCRFEGTPWATVEAAYVDVVAVLSGGVTDADDLPPYERLDPVLRGYVEGGRDGDELRADYSDEVVDTAVARVTRSEFKRRQTPPPLRITQKAFGRGWNYPVAAVYDDVLPDV